MSLASPAALTAATRLDYAGSMGQPDQWLKAVLAEETPELTGRAAVFEAAPEIRTTELQPDGLLRTTTPAALRHLAPPWSLLRHEAVFDGKMPGDHLGPEALQRCSFRREARQEQRLAREEGRARVDPNPDDCAAWVLAPHVAAWLRAWERAGRLVLMPAGAGCWWVTPSAYPLLWIAANELPLRVCSTRGRTDDPIHGRPAHPRGRGLHRRLLPRLQAREEARRRGA